MTSDDSARLRSGPLPFAWELVLMSFGAFMATLSPDLAMVVIGVFGFGQIVASFAFAKYARKEDAKDA